MPWKWILAAVWLIAWSLAARGFWGASEEHGAEAARLALPLTGVEPDSDVRVEAIVAPGPMVRSPITQHEGVAVRWSATYVAGYYDAQDKPQHDVHVLATRTVGPSQVALEANGKRFALPMDRFAPDSRWWPDAATSVQALPAELQIPAEDIERAKSQARGKLDHYGLSEWVIQPGMKLFIAGHLSARDPKTGDLLLEKDRILDRIEIVPGTQAAVVERRRGSSSGLRVAGYIVLGLGFLPALILGLLALRRRSAEPAAPARS